MTSQCESKVHLPLADGQIRLLKLKPASTLSDPIECNLFVKPPTTNTRYEAVSYVWGNQNRRKGIKVNNVDFQITGNLFELLPYLRQHDSDRVLWIDGLCIDQTNDTEKCRQVNMMGDIYKGASHVIIFLGREWDALDIAIKYLGLAAQQQDAHLDPALEPHLHVDGQSISAPQVQGSLTMFFGADWFFRVWTVQEFVLAKSFSFQYGSTIIDGDLVSNGFLALRRHAQNQCCGPRSIMKCGQEFLDVITHTDVLIDLRSNAERSFLETLDNLRRRCCRDSRDRVYGMLGMDFTGPNHNISPDYSISVAQLFINVAQQEIKHTGTLDIFGFNTHGTETSLSLPSFVPDWTLRPSNHFAHLMSVDRHLRLSHYNASRGSQAQFHFRFDDLKRRATVNGVLIDRIKTVGDICSLDPSNLAGAIPIVKQARGLSNLPDLLPASFEAASGNEVQFWRTMCGNLGVNYLEKHREWKPADPAADFDSYLKWYNAVNSKQDYDTSQWKDQTFPDALIPNLSGRRFILMENGDIGMADAKSQQNDVVMVLAGGKVPYILREENEAGTSRGHKPYRLIGDAYVDGKMEGEAIMSNAKWMEVTLI